MAEVVEVAGLGTLDQDLDVDLDALGHLYDRYRGRVAGFAHARLGDPDKAEDVTSETFEAVLRRLGGYRLGTDFEAWLFTIAHRRVSDHFRRQSRRREQATLHEAPAPDAAGPEKAALAAEDRTEVARAFSPLRGDEQEVLALRVLAGLSAAQAGAVRVAQHRALRSLRVAMGVDAR